MQVDPFGQNINKPHVTHHASPHMTRVMAISPRVISPSPITFRLFSDSSSNAGDGCESNMTARAAPVQIFPGKGLGFISMSLSG